jgi:hypothetical protein
MNHSWGNVVAASLLSIAALNFSARCEPMVDFFSPPVQQTPPLVGKLTGVTDPTKYKLLVLVSGNLTIWNDKTHLMPTGNYAQGGEGLPIAADGSFSAANWQSIPLNTWELTTPYLGIWVVPTTFDARWAVYQVEGTSIPKMVTDAMLCYVIKNRKNEVVKRWPEITAVHPLISAAPNLNNVQQQERTLLFAANGRQLTNVNRTSPSLVRGIYVAAGRKNGARTTLRINTVGRNNQ